MMNHYTRSLLQGCVAVCIAGAAIAAHAQENSIESISANQQGSNVIVKIAMKNPVQKPPIGFSTTNWSPRRNWKHSFMQAAKSLQIVMRITRICAPSQPGAVS